jgi:hypothetical protein
MLSRGARKLVFLGRSGARSPKSKELLERLDAGGAEVKVMQTDITNYAEVKRTISAVDGSIGGIVHAAMGLSVRPPQRYFVRLTNDYLGGFIHANVSRVLAHRD